MGNTDYSYADNDEFSFEKTKNNLTAVVDNFNSYILNVGHANDCVSSDINGGDSCAICSPTLGPWLAALWDANTTYADSFKDNFVEWSNVVQHIMLHTSQMNDEAMDLFTSFEGVADLTFSFYGNKNAGVTITNAEAATNARHAWEDLQHKWFMHNYKDEQFDGSAFTKFFNNASDDEKQAVYDRALTDFKKNIEYYYRYGGYGTPQFDTTNWDPITAILGKYWNTNGKMPEESEVPAIISNMGRAVEHAVNPVNVATKDLK